MGKVQKDQIMRRQSIYQQDFMALMLTKGDMHLPNVGWPTPYGCMLRCASPFLSKHLIPAREKPFHKRPSILKSYHEKSNEINRMETLTCK